MTWKLATGIILVSLLTGCHFFSPPAKNQPTWSKHSLDSGPDVRIRIIRKAYFTHAMISWSDGKVLLLDEEGKTIEQPENSRKIFFKMKGSKVAVAFKRSKSAFKKAKKYKQVWIKTPGEKIRQFTVHIPEQRFLRDYDARAFNISIKYGRMAVINVLPLELYLSQVIPEEMDPEHFTLEALKAQAVVARTWALKSKGRHARFDYDFCDGPHCQVYKGRKRVSFRAERAVKMTLGEVIVYQGKLAEAFYHSTCGGNTVFVNEVWAGRTIPYLTRVEDRWKTGNRAYCSQSPYARWRIHTSLRRVERALKKQKWITSEEKLKAIAVDFINRSGRVKRIRCTTDKQELLLTSNEFRSAINKEYGKRRMLSNFYTLDVAGNQFRVVGHGLGHGVGLCQWGARGMAQHGFTYKQILGHYFQNTTIGENYGENEPVSAGSTTQNSLTDVK